MGMSDRLRCTACLVFVVASTGMVHGLSPDPRILSLIPRNAEIVDGSAASPAKAGLMSFLVFRTENAVDLMDFRGLVGADASKAIRQIFLVGGTERPSPRFEHSIISLGRFNHGRIYEAAVQNGAHVRAYRAMEVLEMNPFARDQQNSSELRWLAVIGPDLAVFGTIGNVREELDRYLDHTLADLSLLERFNRLRPDDETWCLLANTVQKDGIRHALGSLDARFLDLIDDGSQFQFGIHYGGRIRFDYESNASAIEGQKTGTLADPGKRSFVSAEGATTGTHTVRGALAIARTRYEKWLSELLKAKSGPEHPAAVDHARQTSCHVVN